MDTIINVNVNEVGTHFVNNETANVFLNEFEGELHESSPLL
jgi:hypothetical protein